MARTYKSETIMDRTQFGRKPCSNEFLEYQWRTCFRNGGANPKTHPIAEDEIRVCKDSFNLSLEEIKVKLEDYGFTYREDGYCEEGLYI